MVEIVLDTATDVFGRDVVANAIMLGYLAKLTGVASHESLRQAIAESVPPKTVDVNLKAFDEGLDRGAQAKMRAGDTHAGQA